jgi:class 3 adenylate cyclase/streptogramin lyase
VRDATSATATFLFTDIEGSTRLLKEHRDAYPSILAEHHRILREAFEVHGGREVDNQGDAFFVAFRRAKDAVLAAADIQRALASHSWPGEATVRVRMGIHTGEADLAADRYVGMSVHRAARISAIGHGGQVLVSPITAGLLDDEPDLPGVSLRSLGEHRLKDIPRPVQLYQLDVNGLGNSFPPVRSAPREPNRRRRLALAGAALLALVLTGAAVAWMSRDAPPPEVLPDSLVRIDPSTLEPTDVIPVGTGADQVVLSGGYVWVMHHVIRDVDSGEIRNAGDHTITRVDPSTGEASVVGGGLAPCGMTADPSGDVWVANCFPPESGGTPNVMRVDAETLDFEQTWSAPSATDGFIRGFAYGGGSLWLSDIFGSDTPPAPPYSVLQVNPQTGARRSFPLNESADGLGWSEGYGDLWVSHFSGGSVSRLHPATEDVEYLERVAQSPVYPEVDRDSVWVGDWGWPRVVRLPAVGQGRQRTVELPVDEDPIVSSAVWDVDAGAGAIWVVTPRFGALWRIDPESEAVTEIPLPYFPSGVAADDDAVWVTIRSE